MGRFVGVVSVITLLAAAPASAAELTRVATSGDPNNPFDLDFSIRWERLQKRATISKEVTQAGAGSLAEVIDTNLLRVSDVTNVVVPRVAVGLYQDLELHLEIPYYLAREDGWRYGLGPDGLPVDQAPISGNTIQPDGGACAGPCPLFPVGGGTTVFQGGVAGDVKAGLTWGIFSDRRDDTKPFWLVGLDVTFPSAKRYDPAKGRDASWLSPYSSSSTTGPVGQKAWKYDFYTALSRRMGILDPYFKAHLTAMSKSSSTYSNCDEVAFAASQGQASATAVANCALPQWKDKAGARLPYLAGLTFGTEIVPFEDAAAGQKVVIDLRASADYTSSARWYNELTDATGKLLQTDSYVTILGTLGVLFRASEYVAVQGSASLGTVSSHLITGEALGANGGADQNPNYDWRWDAPGRRFRVGDVSLFNLQATFILQF
ncbi:MAG TPA: hypothetical protein VFP50_02005 [Anaeromyxobacteraceae bacterium]|nr:hypothetical protein [Anaeromyxobacteraceae bacterium]